MRVRGLIVSLAFLLVGAAPAMATTRYAAPGSTNSSGDCAVAANPCELVYAFNTALGPGDELVLAPGDYGSPSSPLTTGLFNPNPVSVHGQPGRRTRIFESTSGFGPALLLNGGGDPSVRDVEVLNLSMSTYEAVAVNGTIERVTARSSNGPGCWVRVAAIDSLCVGKEGLVSSLAPSTPETDDVTLRNVTAIGAGGPGVRISAYNSATFDVTAVNVIARGTLSDLQVSNDSASSAAKITFGYSNYDPARVGTSGANSSVAQFPMGTNQTAAPVFVNPAAGDFHQAATSPTIDHGVTDPANGSLDLDGNSRTLGASTDIGAYEAPPSGAPPQPPFGNPGPHGGGTVLSSLAISPWKQSVAGRQVNGKCVKPNKNNNSNKRCQRPAQLTISSTLSATANVTFTLFRQTQGRKVNGKCVRTTKKNQKHKKCTFYPTLASVTRGSGAGTNSFTVKGKLFGQKLTPGTYILRGQLPGGAALDASFRIKS